METSQLVLLRSTAFLVDSILLSLSLMIPATLVSWGVVSIRESSQGVEIIWLAAGALAVIGILLRDGWNGRSPGKRLLGLRVATVSGKPCGYGRSLVRNVPLMVPGWNLIEVYLLVFSADCRRTGDRMAGTNVTEE